MTPIRPIHAYSAEEAIEAFRCLQNGDHIGKVILKMPQDNAVNVSIAPAASLVLDSKASYLLAGGLGGLGRSIAIWMVEHGARDLIFLSPRAGLKAGDQAFFTELGTMGCSVSAIAGRTQNLEDVRKAISSASNPIKGVLQLAMVLCVRYLINI